MAVGDEKKVWMFTRILQFASLAFHVAAPVPVTMAYGQE